MIAQAYRKQLQTVLLIEIAILSCAAIATYLLWSGLCNGSWQSCLAGEDGVEVSTFLLVSMARPLILTPFVMMAFVAGDAYGPILGPVLAALGGVLSCLTIYLPAAYLGRRLVRPWLRSNLPATWKLIRTQDYKVVFITRLIPIFPFDFLSLLFGAVGFRWRAVLVATFVGSLPEAFMLGRLAKDPSAGIVSSTLQNLTWFAILLLAVLLLYEFLSRKGGTSLWTRVRRMYDEIIYEVQLNNDIVKRYRIDGSQTPVLLLYGFFSSRRSLTIMEKLLSMRGYQVLSFNLGGMLGVFFTRGIMETARFIDFKLKRQMQRHGFKKVHVVGHSKGGLVAIWWLLRLGGHRYCDKVVTMGTPFKGSRLTYLALVTPLGLFWRDVWQMRPGSEFLRELAASPIPEGKQIHCFFSKIDRVATGRKGLFEPDTSSDQIIPIERNNVTHFDFLCRRDVADQIADILSDTHEHGAHTDVEPPREKKA